MSRRRLLILLILLTAVWLRLHALGAQSFWNDEGNSARLSERSVRLILEGTAADVHPPLYYLLLRGWRELGGAGEFALRLPSAWAGVLLTAVVWALGRRWRLSPAPAAFWVALSPPLVYYGQEARMYTLLPLWVWLGLLLLLRWQRRPTALRGAAYALSLTAGLYTHYIFPLALPLHAGVLLWEQRGRARLLHRFGRWAVWVGAAGLLYTPWLPTALGGLGGNRGVPQPWSAFLEGSARFLLTGATWAWDGRQTALWSALLAAALLAALADGRRLAPLLWLWGLPLAALLAVRATDPAFYKFTLMAVPALALWMTAVGARLAGRGVWLRGLTAVVGLVLALWMGLALRELYANPAYARADYRGMAARIAAERHPNAGIILNAPNQWEVFTYYHREGAPVYPLPRVRDRAAVEAELAELAARHIRLYVLYWGDQQQDPERWVETWLDAHTFRAREEWVGDVRFVLYASPASAETAVDPTPLAARFGEEVQLNGYALTADNLRPGDALLLTLFWEALRPPTTRYKVFVHLLDADGRLVGQKDGEPQPPTTDWPVGAPQRSNHGVVIDPALPPGTYTLVVGLYDWLAPTRRLLTADGRDALVLQTIAVGAP